MSAPTGSRVSYPAAPPIEATPEPPAAWAHLPVSASPVRHDPRVIFTIVLGALAVVAAVFASFAPWVHYADGVQRDGVAHGDGWFVIVTACVAAGVLGAVAAGVRHLGVRLAIAASGLVLFALYGLNRLAIANADDQLTGQPPVPGGGLYVVAFAALGMVVASLAMPSTPWWGPRSERRAVEVTTTST